MRYSGYFSFDAHDSSFLIETCVASGFSRFSFFCSADLFNNKTLCSESPFVSEVLRRARLTTMIPFSEAMNKENR